MNATRIPKSMRPSRIIMDPKTHTRTYPRFMMKSMMRGIRLDTNLVLNALL